MTTYANAPEPTADELDEIESGLTDAVYVDSDETDELMPTPLFGNGPDWLTVNGQPVRFSERGIPLWSA